jgi:hypothetical protein
MPVDRSAIDAQLREIGEGERWWEQREFRDLPYILQPDARILGITVGKLLGRRRPRVRAGRWLIVATNQRILCLNQGHLARKQVEVPVTHIVRMGQGNGFRSHQITIETPDRRYRIRIPKADAYRFAGALAALVPARQQQRLPGDLEPLAWIPGITTVAALPGVAGILSKVSTLSPPDYATRDHVERLEATVERLQEEVERLQQQVGFLEKLLEKQHENAFAPRSPTDS